MNILELIKKFLTQENCIKHFENVRWGVKVKCVYCKCENTNPLVAELRHHCNGCRKSFSATVGTIFHHTHIELQKWFLVMSLMLNARKGVSSSQIANDYGSSINIDVKGNNNIILCPVITVNSLDSNAIQNKIRKYIDGIDEMPKIYEKELMYWANASFINQKTTDKVIIEKIDKKPRKVVFLNDHEKSVATSYNSKFPNKQWQDLAYIVDVEVSYIQDSPKEYKITRLYKEEIFDPEDNS